MRNRNILCHLCGRLTQFIRHLILSKLARSSDHWPFRTSLYSTANAQSPCRRRRSNQHIFFFHPHQWKSITFWNPPTLTSVRPSTISFDVAVIRTLMKCVKPSHRPMADGIPPVLFRTDSRGLPLFYSKSFLAVHVSRYSTFAMEGLHYCSASQQRFYA